MGDGNGRLMIGYPHSTTVHGAFLDSILRFTLFDSANEQRLYDGGGFCGVMSGPRISHARNTIVRRFLDREGQPEWLMMIDTDMRFEPEDVYDLIYAADPVERPVIGGLCFGGGERAGVMFPTMYQLLDPAEHEGAIVRQITDFPRNAICKVDATGAAFLLMHRSALEKVGVAYAKHREGDQEFPNPSPWFAETIHRGREFGEDWTLCMRLQHVGVPIHVHTGIQIGHIKDAVLNVEAWDRYQAKKEVEAQQVAAETAEPAVTLPLSPDTHSDIPTYVVIPVKDRNDMTRRILRDLHRQGGYEGIFVFDNGSKPKNAEALDKFIMGMVDPDIRYIPAEGWGLHRMWNEGVKMANNAAIYAMPYPPETPPPVNVAILNNDLDIGEKFLPGLAHALRSYQAVRAVCANYDKRPGEGLQTTDIICGGRYDGTGGFAGFAFMVKGEDWLERPAFDERFSLWFGDTDFVRQAVEDGAKVAIALDTHVEHIDGGSQTAKSQPTAELQARIEADRQAYAEKWGG